VEGTGRTYLNSRLSARTASLALFSLADALSHTSRTRTQSSEAVAVKYPMKIGLTTSFKNVGVNKWWMPVK